MKAGKIKTVLQYHKSNIELFTHGYSNGVYTEFTNIETIVRIYDKRPEGLYDIDKEIYDAQKQLEDGDEWINADNLNLGDAILSIPVHKVLDKLQLMAKFCGKDDLRPVMSGIYFNNQYFAATDAHKLQYFEHGLDIADSVGEFECIIPPAIIKMLDKDVKTLTVLTRGVCIKTEVDGVPADVFSRSIDGKYPNFMAVIPEPSYYTKSVLLTQDTIKDMVDKNKKYGSKKTNQVAIYDNNTWVVEDFDLGTKHVGECKIEKAICNEVTTILMPVMNTIGGSRELVEGTEIAFNIKFLQEISNKQDVRIFFNEPNKAICIQYIESKKKTPKKPTRKAAPKKEVAPVNDNADLLAKIAELEAENESLKAELEALKVTEEKMVAPSVEIVDYSERALALFGEATRDFKEQIKHELYGKFVPGLTKDGVKTPGWIVSKKFEAQARALFS